MPEKPKQYALGCCLFVFLFVVIGGGFHLTSAAAFIGAMSGTPLVIFVFNRWSSARFQVAEALRDGPASGVTVRDRP